MEKRNLVVIGCGRQAAAMVYDFCRWGKDGFDDFILADRDGAQIKKLKARVTAALKQDAVAAPRFIAKQIDATKPAQLQRLLKGARLVMSSSHYAINPLVAKAAISAGVCYGDLGGYLDSSLKIQKMGPAALKKNIFVAPDLGLAPGFANILAGWGLKNLESGMDLAIYCGGLPERPVGPLGYKIVFAVEGLWGTHFGKTTILRNGQPAQVDNLSEVESVDSPAGVLEAFITNGALATAPWAMKDRVRNYIYKTLRYPGYVEKFGFLRDLGLTEAKPVAIGRSAVAPRELLGKLFLQKLSYPEVRDRVVLRVDAEGVLKSSGRPVRTVFEAAEHCDEKLGFSAMERTTGFPAAIAAQMLLKAGAKGFVLQEEVIDTEAFIEELKKRNINVTQREEICRQPKPEKNQALTAVS